LFNKRNEKGYALLIVLFLITFIMIASATFVSASVSNAKQEKTVDSNNTAVAAAEMGVDYYKTALSNELNSNKERLIELGEDRIKLLVKEIIEKNLSEAKIQERLKAIQISLAENLEELLIITISNLDKTVDVNLDNAISFDGEKLFDPNNVYWINDGGSVVVMGDIKGKNKEWNQDLTFEMEIILPNIKSLKLDADPDSYVGNFDFNHLIPEDIKGIENLCKTTGTLTGVKCKGDATGTAPKLQNLNNSTIYYPVGYTHTNSNNPDFNGTKIYSDGNIDIKNMNSMSEGFLFVNGNVDAKNLNGTGISDSTIIVKESMTAAQMKVNHSDLAINKNLTVGDHLTVENNSRICVGGKLTVNGKLEIDNSSAIYVLKSMNSDNYDYKNKSRHVILVEDLESLWGKCGIGSEKTEYPSISDDWDEPIIDVIY